MALVFRQVADPSGGMRIALPGDLVVTNEIVPAGLTATPVTVTGPILANGIILASPTAAATYTFDTAANIIAALSAQYGYNPNAQVPGGTLVYQGISPATSFRVAIVVSTAFAVTLTATANTGVTVNRGTIAASSTKDVLITVRNGTPAQTVAGNTTNASAVVSGFTSDQLSRLSIGMVVTNAVANLQGQTIISINQNAGTVTMSANANATAVGSAINFSPVIVADVL
jgi:hypothetical protein